MPSPRRAKGTFAYVHPNEFLYLTVDCEGETKLLRPTFLASGKKAIEAAKQKALDGFLPALDRRLRNLKGPAAAPAEATPLGGR